MAYVRRPVRSRTGTGYTLAGLAVNAFHTTTREARETMNAQAARRVSPVVAAGPRPRA